MPVSTPIITLLTDFGTRDAFVGTMKGVLLSRCVIARVVDLSHEVDPWDILGASLLLRSAAPFFPPGTVHLVVVDPGVGGVRRPIAIRSGAFSFVGPDNGVLWPAASLVGEPLAYLLSSPRYRLAEVGTTFHGRDLFAPVAAALAAGVPIQSVGPVCPDPVPLSLPVPAASASRVDGEILWIDRFGNAITNIAPSIVREFVGERFRLRLETLEVIGPATHYAAGEVGAPVVVPGSLGFYEIAVHRGSAALQYHLTRGMPVCAEPASRRRD